MNQAEKLTIVIAGGGSTYTPGIISSLLSHSDRFPMKEIRLYDNDSDRNEDMKLIIQQLLKEDVHVFYLGVMLAMDFQHQTQWLVVLMKKLSVSKYPCYRMQRLQILVKKSTFVNFHTPQAPRL